MVWDSSDGALEFADNAKAIFGGGSDLAIYHDGSNSYIKEDGTGSLYIQAVNLVLENTAGSNYFAGVSGGASLVYFNGTEKLATKTDGVNITGELECDTLDVDGNVDFDGGALTFNAGSNRLDFADNVHARFGSSQDLSIYHDSNNSYIVDSGTGSLFVQSNSFRVLNAAGTKNEIIATESAGVDLFFDNAKKAETEAYGFNVTGTIDTDTLIVTGVSTVASLIFSAGTNTNGVSYFDANGQVQSTVSPASGISTSNSILTTNASGVPIWTDTIDCGTF